MKRGGELSAMELVEGKNVGVSLGLMRSFAASSQRCRGRERERGGGVYF